MPREDIDLAERYLRSCQSHFWQKVFRIETDYLRSCLNVHDEVLSIGCGPAIIEGRLAQLGFHVTGLDISQQALGCAPDRIRTVRASAQTMPFQDSSFDAVICVASLQFIEDYRMAIQEAARVLRPQGKMIAMLLNPNSAFFRERVSHEDSYIHSIRHTNIMEIEMHMSSTFGVQTEYFMGVKDMNLFDSSDPYQAALYIIRGKKSMPESLGPVSEEDHNAP